MFPNWRGLSFRSRSRSVLEDEREGYIFLKARAKGDDVLCVHGITVDKLINLFNLDTRSYCELFVQFLWECVSTLRISSNILVSVELQILDQFVQFQTKVWTTAYLSSPLEPPLPFSNFFGRRVWWWNRSKKILESSRKLKECILSSNSNVFEVGRRIRNEVKNPKSDYLLPSLATWLLSRLMNLRHFVIIQINRTCLHNFEHVVSTRNSHTR